MKKIITMLSVILLAQMAWATTANIKVNGMVCSFCAQGIEKKFKKDENVKNIKVDLDNKLVSLEFKEGKNISDKDLTESLKKSGYDVVKIDRK